MSDWRIIGFGSPLMGDDGAGPAIIAELHRRRLPEGVDLVDGGTGGHLLLEMMAGADRVLLIDAIEMGAPPGAVRRLTLDEVLIEEPPGWSLHQGALAGSLLLGRELGQLPPILVLLGVQPQRVERRLELTPPVAAAVRKAVGMILAELAGPKRA